MELEKNAHRKNAVAHAHNKRTEITPYILVRIARHHTQTDRVTSSCRSFNLATRLSHFIIRDAFLQIAHRIVDGFGLALELLTSTLICSAFLSELLQQFYDFPRQLICANHCAPHLLKMWSSFRCTYAPQNLIMQYHIH